MIGRRTMPFAAPVLLAAGLLATGCSPTEASPAPRTVDVEIRDLQFVPGEVEVSVGDTVRWVFDDGGMFHHVEATDGSFDSEIVGEGMFSVTFSEAGTHPYACSIHPYMTGTVTVSE
ncbi:plastocyanin [Microbacterium sp. ZKA21]|uniref:cupredoxin domain-containing protein n=1 Tax=Microbacterium sp. ZKA21 TaxID=3381694 RepID=UPI003D1A037A